MGVLVGLLVGVIFVYQVIASDIKGRLAEFATLALTAAKSISTYSRLEKT